MNPEQEEMALAFVKCSPERLEDPVFVRNFLRDFCKALNLDGGKLEDFDFSEIRKWIETNQALTKEHKKELAERRKKENEERKQKYGYAIIDGQKVEVNYRVEPPCIFVGRGKHPLRGRWKPRVHYSDIILNLSPDAPTPPTPDGSSWGGRVWEPNALWIAKWRDKLTGKMKYIWIADTAKIKQEREKKKFELAKELEKKLPEMQKHILRGLESPDPQVRKIATVAYLIDLLKIRVGDEKDPDELDTVGATTLKKSNVKILGEDKVKFDFLGKGAVRFRRIVRMPPQVVRNLKECMEKSKSSRIFPDVRCEQVNEFLGKIVPGITAKVFRTYYASKEVEKALREARLSSRDHPYKKVYVAKMANLRAARILNHKKKPPKKWKERVERMQQRIKQIQERIEKLKKKRMTKRNRERLRKLRQRLREQKLKLDLVKKTKGYNLATSLRSYINPEIYARWAKQVEVEVERIYTRSLLRKFAWAFSEQPT